jgi:hypothetical protein
MRSAKFWYEDIKRPLQRHRHSWEVNIKMNLKVTGREGLDCVHLAQSKDHRWTPVNTGSIKCWEFLN